MKSRLHAGLQVMALALFAALASLGVAGPAAAAKLKVAAITVGGVGYRTMKGTGDVFKLGDLKDIEGVYRGGAAGLTSRH